MSAVIRREQVLHCEKLVKTVSEDFTVGLISYYIWLTTKEGKIYVGFGGQHLFKVNSSQNVKTVVNTLKRQV